MQVFKNGLVKKSIVYMFFNAINGAIPFFLLPVLTTYLLPSAYGTVSLFQTTLAFAIPIISFSMGFNIDRLFFKITKEELARVMGNMIVLLFASVFIVTLIVFVLQYYVNFAFIGIPITWLVLIPIIAGMSSISSYNLIILRNRDKVANFGFWQILQTILNLGLSLLLVVSFSMNWRGRLYGITIALIITGILSLINLFKTGYIVFNYNFKEIKKILKICSPLIFHGFGTFVIFQSNLYFINSIVGKTAVGIFSVATAFAAIMGILQDAVAKTINPWFYKNLSSINDGIKKRIVKMNTIINLVFVFMAFIIYGLSIFLIKFMTEESYHSASSLVLLLTLALAFNGMYKISSIYFINFSKTKLLSILTLVTAFFSVILNYFLILKYGLLGASYAFCFSLFLQFVLTFIFSQKIYPLPIKETLKQEILKYKVYLIRKNKN